MVCVYLICQLFYKVIFVTDVAKHLERANLKSEDLILAPGLRVTVHGGRPSWLSVALLPWEHLTSHSCFLTSWGNRKQGDRLGQIEASSPDSTTLIPLATPISKKNSSPIPLPPTGKQVLKYPSLRGRHSSHTVHISHLDSH